MRPQRGSTRRDWPLWRDRLDLGLHHVGHPAERRVTPQVVHSLLATNRVAALFGGAQTGRESAFMVHPSPQTGTPRRSLHSFVKRRSLP